MAVRLKHWRWLHRIIGVFGGAIFALVALTGAALLYKNALLAGFYPSLGEHRSDPLPSAARIETVLLTLGSESNSIRRVRMPTSDWPFFDIAYRDGARAYWSVEGEPLVQTQGWSNPVQVLFEIHADWLLGHTGERANGYFHLAVVVMLVAGIFAWWPRNWRKALVFTVKGRWVKWLFNWHRSLGALLVLPLLLAVLTGVIMVFYTEVRLVLYATLGGSAKATMAPLQPAPEAINWPRVYHSMHKTFPEAQLRSVDFPATSEKPVVVRKRMPAEWHQNGRSFVYIHPASGEVLAVVDATEVELGQSLLEKVYPLHSGAVGGSAYRFLLAVAGASVLLFWGSGLALWLRRKRR